MQIPEARSIMVQPMLKGTELFIGAKDEEKFGHVVLFPQPLGPMMDVTLPSGTDKLKPDVYKRQIYLFHSMNSQSDWQQTVLVYIAHKSVSSHLSLPARTRLHHQILNSVSYTHLALTGWTYPSMPSS